MKIVLLFAVSLFGLAAPLTVQREASSEARSNEGSQTSEEKKALELAKAKYNKQSIFGGEQAQINYIEMLVKTHLQSPSYMKFEQQFPGSVHEIAQAEAAVSGKWLIKRLPELQSLQASNYLKLFNSTEMDVLIDYYGSPSGQQFLQAIEDNRSNAAYQKEFASSKGKGAGDKAYLEDMDASVNAAVDALPPEDKRKYLNFRQSSAAKKEHKVRKKFQLTILKWFGDADPEFMNQTDAAVNKIIDKYLKTGTTK